ncbi:MAG: Putative transmembrane protein HieC [uncultured Sulfurovum sp.]|uniref:Transmembrane protein HieC n=1 Tax=uncultured Sulfurovum sp. TaxID=269237 RepID=A0A6S6TXG1_9BACT|nr:MAG: Putative transmembrane protein HieC [uncultured Sulfurovum sp.]
MVNHTLKKRLKSFAYALGKSLGIIGLVYLFYALYQEYTFSSFIENFYTIAHILPQLFILNILSILIGILAWHYMLTHYAQNPFKYLLSYYYFCKTEVAKYLPGNIFHFLGRQALASKVGITQSQMAKSSLLFTLLLLSATILASTLFTLFVTEIPTVIMILMILASLVTFIGLIFIYKSFPLMQKIKMNILLTLSISLQGIMLGMIVISQLEEPTLQLFLLVASIYIVSWLIGFVTPGASGGLGVREGSFIAMMNYLEVNIATDIIIFSVLLVRLINIFTDILTYLSTFLLSSKINKADM